MKKMFLALTCCLLFVNVKPAAANPEINTDNSTGNIIIPQTEEEIKLSEEKMKLAEEYVENTRNQNSSSSGRVKRSAPKKGWGGSRIYPASSRKLGSTLGDPLHKGVGNRKQETPDWCGPATVYNIAEIYDFKKYGGYRSASQHKYSLALGVPFHKNTPFSETMANTLNRWVLGNNYTLFNANNVFSTTEWTSKLKNGIIWTIDKDNGYGKTGYSVAVNMNYVGGSEGANDPVHRYYGGRNVAHWVTVYGYDDTNGNNRVWISDSNQNLDARGIDPIYFATFSQLAKASKARGMVY